MNLSTAGLVVTAIAANALASLLLKRVAVQPMRGMIACLPPQALGLAGLALLFYAVAFVVYALVLRTLPVSKAYTLITFGAQMLLILAGIFYFGERYTPMAWVGLGMVMVGLVLVARSAVP